MGSRRGNPAGWPRQEHKVGKRTKQAEHFEWESVQGGSLGFAVQLQLGLQAREHECLSVWFQWDGMHTCRGASNHADEFEQWLHAAESELCV